MRHMIVWIDRSSGERRAGPSGKYDDMRVEADRSAEFIDAEIILITDADLVREMEELHASLPSLRDAKIWASYAHKERAEREYTEAGIRFDRLHDEALRRHDAAARVAA